MQCKGKLGNLAACFCLAVFSGIVYADDTTLNSDLPTAASYYGRNLLSSNALPAVLAANEADVIQGKADNLPVIPAEGREPPLLSGRKAHQYLGLGTVALAGLTMLAAPGEEEGGSPSTSRQTSGTTHTRLARATATMAIATVLTGLIYHWDDFHLEDGFSDPDNQHVLLAGTGALMLLYAVNKSAKSTEPTSHAGIAELGAVSMLVAIKLTW